MKLCVVQNNISKLYATTKHIHGWTSDIKQAYVFKRKCDASQMVGRTHKGRKDCYDIVELKVLPVNEVKEDDLEYKITCKHIGGLQQRVVGTHNIENELTRLCSQHHLHKDYFQINRLPNKWDLRFLSFAKHVSTWSKDPSTKCGAVIVGSEREVLSVGYNGFARGVDDSAERYADRELKYKMVVHCERNAIIFADRTSLKGATLYTWPFMSCSVCSGFVIQSGIKRCVAPSLPAHLQERWGEDIKIAQTQFEEAGIALDIIPLEDITSE